MDTIVLSNNKRLIRCSILIFGGLLTSSGCDQGSPKAEVKPAETSQAAADAQKDRCRQRLSSAVQKLKPDSMALQTRRESVVNSLNSWLTSCVADAGKASQLSSVNAAMLSPAAQRFATSARFTENDTVYIRDCLLLRSLVESIWKQADAAAKGGVASDPDRIVLLFSEIMRMVSLMNDTEERVPVGIYEVLLTGRGRLEDRTWIFAEALRQRQIDAFLLQTDAAADESNPNDILNTAGQLVGVIADSRVLLFDPARGTAVPLAGDNSLLVTSPAGIGELSAHARWKSPGIRLIAHPASFSPRMLVLQEQLPADNAATLYEELAGGGSEIRPLQERIAEAGTGLWTTDTMAIWDYPEKATSSAAGLDETQQQAYALLLKPYDAPFERDPLKSEELFENPGVTDEQLSEAERDYKRREMLMERLRKIEESSEELFGKASKRLLSVRVEQIMGTADVGMIQQLQQIRIASMQDYVEVNVPLPDKKEAVIPYQLPEAIRQVHRNATGDSLFWTSQCQVARGDLGASVNTFRNYRRQYPTEKWVTSSFLQEALSLIRMGNASAARVPLTEADQENNPELLQVRWLLSRLPQSLDAEAAPTPAEPTPAEPAPAEPTPAEPAPAEPAPAEPAPAEPAPAEPAPAEPAPAEPAPAEPAPAEPTPAEPTPAEPAPAEK
jgi:hypothetical protein